MATNEADLKVLTRIKKLHAMAESARAVGSLAEAESFMEAVEKTLAAHNLEMSALSIDMKDLTDPMTRGWTYCGIDGKRGNREEVWGQILADAVATAHYCGWHYGIKSNGVSFIGRSSNVKTALQMYNYLRDMAHRLGQPAYLAEEARRHREYGTASGAANWKWNWFQGFAGEVANRYRMMRARVESDTGMQVVLVSVRKEADEFGKQFLRKKKDGEVDDDPGDGTPLGAHARDQRAREEGIRAARTAPLNPNALDDGPTRDPRRLKG